MGHGQGMAGVHEFGIVFCSVHTVIRVGEDSHHESRYCRGQSSIKAFIQLKLCNGIGHGGSAEKRLGLHHHTAMTHVYSCLQAALVLIVCYQVTAHRHSGVAVASK